MFDLQAKVALGGSRGDEVKMVVTGALLGTLVGQLVDSNLANGTGAFFDAKVGFYQNGLVPDENTDFADLVESNFTGYDRSANVTFSPAGLDESGHHVTVGDVPVPFQCTGDTDQQIMGVFLSPADGSNVTLASGSLDTPISLANGTLIPVTVVLQVGNSD